jgi:hypothetical protein
MIKVVNSNFVILISGKSTNVLEIKNAFSGFNLIFSTWKGDEQNYHSDDVVLFNEPPLETGPHNFFYQKVCTLNGLYLCKEKGYEYVLKIRNDLIPTNTNDFINIIDFNKINFIGQHIGSPESDRYFIDYFMSGKTEDLIKLWEVDDIRNSDFVEQILTRRFYNHLNNIPVNFILNNLNDNNDLYWLKNNIKISEYKKHDCYKL